MCVTTTMKTESLAERVFPDLSVEERKLIKYDWTAIYSTSSRKAADLISNIMSNYVSVDSVITDATAGIGGNSISLSKKFKKIQSVELDQTRFMYLCNNLNLCNCKNVICYNANYLNICWGLEQDAVLIDPPWGGASVYWDKKPRIYLSNVPIEYVVQRLLHKIPVVAIKVPTNFDIVGLRELLTNYRVHHYKLRKMHLIVCSHNPQKKHENQEVKIPYTEILTNKKENKTNQGDSQQGNQGDTQQGNQGDTQQVNQGDTQQVNQGDSQQGNQVNSQQGNQGRSQQWNPVAKNKIKPSYTSILKRHKK